MNTEEFFNKIYGILKEKDLIPDILDYSLPSSHPTPITTYEFDLKNNLSYGGNEGIYLDLWIEYDKNNKARVGTFKTLLQDREAMRTMALLLADFIVEEYTYVNANLDDFTWEGADVYVFDENGKKLFGYSCSSMEAALKKKDELLKKYGRVIVRDNKSRKEKVFEKK